METILNILVPVTLIFDLLALKNKNVFFYSSKPITPSFMKSLLQMIPTLLSQNDFYNMTCDHDLWPTNSKNNRDLPRKQTSRFVKFKVSLTNSLYYNERNRSVSTDGWTDGQKSVTVIILIRTKSICLTQMGRGIKIHECYIFYSLFGKR